MRGTRGLPPFKSGMAGVAFPSILGGTAATLAALVRELDHSQWLSAEDMSRRQFEQLALLAGHCARHSPAFARRLHNAGLSAADLGAPAGFSRLPAMTRRDIQLAGEDLFCREVPQGHAPLNELKTSGSTGEPVKVRQTAVNALIWSAMTMREHLWHGRDFSQRLCAIRANVLEPQARPDWGSPASLLYETGASRLYPIDRDASVHYAWLAEFAPGHLLIYPNTLDALTQYARSNGGALPSLSHIRTVGETLSPRIREAARSCFGVPVEDLYSSNEIGNIAAQCPESGLYHAMSEGVIVEILDEHGRPSAPGVPGRVTLTSLHNFAMPLIRYDIGDYAEWGDPCPCGRGLPTIARIVGRERNLILMPDGSRYWPVGGMVDQRDVAPVLQWQIVQTAREELELRLVTERTLTQREEDAIRGLILKRLRHPFALHLKYFEGRLPRGPNGKFEEFRCEVR